MAMLTVMASTAKPASKGLAAAAKEEEEEELMSNRAEDWTDQLEEEEEEEEEEEDGIDRVRRPNEGIHLLLKLPSLFFLLPSSSRRWKE